MSVVVNNVDIEIPGLTSVSWRHAPSLRLKMGQDGRLRRTTEQVEHVVLHTTRGIPGGSDPRPQVIKPGLGPAGSAAEANARYWSTSANSAGAALIVDFDGSVVCTADLAREVSYHAGAINGVSIGIEIVQGGAAELYEGQLAAVVTLCAWLADRFHLPRTVQWPFKGAVGARAAFVGHRDLTANRGKGDPGDAIYRRLMYAGWAAVPGPAPGAAPPLPPTLPPPPALASAPPFSWLDAAAELPTPARPTRDDVVFVRATLAALHALGVPRWQACELAAIAALETGWGGSSAVTAHNLGGVKANPRRLAAYQATTTRTARWFRAAGHVAAGDTPVVVYMAYASPEEHWRLWLAEFGGTADVGPTSGIYAEASRRLWATDPAWIEALLRAGYRGAVTAMAPARSVEEHHAVVRRVVQLAAG